MEIVLTLQAVEVQMVLAVLAQRPYEEVANLIAKIHGQATRKAEEPTDGASEGR